MNTIAANPASATHPTRTWEHIGFYLLVLLAAFSPPLFEYRGDFLTIFDLYLLAFLLVKISTTGLAIAGTHWTTLATTFAVFLIYVTVGALRVRTPGAFLLALKQFEYAAFLLVLLDRHQRVSDDERSRDLWFLLLSLFFVILYQIGFYYDILPGIGDLRPPAQRRLGLPFMAGVSSNPAGVFLTAFVIVLFNLSVNMRRFILPSALIGSLAIWALMLTGSRTNAAVLGVVLPLSALVAIWRTRFRWPVVALVLTGVVLMLTFGVDLLPEDGSVGRITRMLREPVSMLEEPSLTIRVDSWVAATDTWLSDAGSFFFGVGLGSLGATDGTVPRVLGELGIIGLALFLYVWYVHYLRFERSSIVVLLLLATLMNGIFAETLFVSFRTVQLYLLLLFLALQVQPGRVTGKVYQLRDLLSELKSFWYFVPAAAVLVPAFLLLFAGPAHQFSSVPFEAGIYAFAGAVIAALALLVTQRLRGARR